MASKCITYPTFYSRGTRSLFDYCRNAFIHWGATQLVPKPKHKGYEEQESTSLPLGWCRKIETGIMDKGHMGRRRNNCSRPSNWHLFFPKVKNTRRSKRWCVLSSSWRLRETFVMWRHKLWQFESLETMSGKLGKMAHAHFKWGNGRNKDRRQVTVAD